MKLSEDSISADVNQLTMSSVMSGGEDNQIDLKSIKFVLKYCCICIRSWRCREKISIMLDRNKD